jgi:hypothetical protein
LYPHLNAGIGEMTTSSAPTNDVKLYPQDVGTNFHLAEITKLRSTLQDEATQRERTRRKYKTAYTASHTINTTPCVVSSGCAIGTLATGVGAIVAFPLGIVSLTTGAVGRIGSTTQNILLRKLEKHDRILALTEAKLNTVDRLVSKALKDDKVTDE